MREDINIWCVVSVAFIGVFGAILFTIADRIGISSIWGYVIGLVVGSTIVSVVNKFLFR